MSRLIEKIKKQSETPPVQMGFRKTLPAITPPSILIIARVTVNETGSPLKNIEGADAVLLDSVNSDLTVKNLPKIVKPLGDTPWGLFLEESKDAADMLGNVGCDFVVFSTAASVKAAPANEKIGKIIQVESAMDDGLLKALNDFPVDAVIAADSFEESGDLSYHHLMILRHLAILISKPLIVPAPASVTKEELKALWDAGIEAVLVTVDVSKGDNLKELHEIASKLPPRTSHKDRKVDVFLPRSGETRQEPPPQEEEEA